MYKKEHLLINSITNLEVSLLDIFSNLKLLDACMAELTWDVDV